MEEAALMRMVCGRLLPFVFILGVSSPAFPQAQPISPLGWGGWARCLITVSGPGYTDSQTQTWIITGQPTKQGAFYVYPGSWTAVGGGSLQRSDATQSLTAQWATNAPAMSAPFAVFVRASDGQMLIQMQHAQVRGVGAIQGFQQLTINGKPQKPVTIGLEAFERPLPAITIPRGATTAAGSSTTELKGSVGVMQPAGSRAAAVCSWQFGQGAAAPRPPPALPAQAIPTPLAQAAR